MAYIGREPLGGEVILMNSIESQFNGVLTTFNLTRTVSGVTSAFYPVGSQQLLVSLGGVIQRPDPTGDTGFRISFNTIIFAIAPAAGTSCFIISYGNLIDIGAPANNTVSTDKLVDGSVTPVKLSTGGPWWLSNGNVGIGTTNPGFNLDVYPSSGSAGVRAYAPTSNAGFFEAAGSNNTVRARLQSSGTDAWVGTITNHEFWIATNNDRKVTVTSGGYVGIGVTAPVAAFQVLGSNGAGLRVDQGNYNYHGAFNHVFMSSGFTSTFMTIDNAGSVGIGTTTPSYKLDVEGGQNVTTQISLWGRTIGQPQTLIEPGRIYATAAGLGPGDLLLQPTGGNIGIGTTSASERFHLHSQFSGLSAIRLSGSATLQIPYDIRQGIVGVSNAGFSVYDVTAAATRFAIDSAGNVGVGVANPVAKLHIDGSIHQAWNDSRIGIFYDNDFRQGLTYSTSTRTLKIFSTSSDTGGNIAFYTRLGVGASDTDYGSEKLRIAANGNVGIGTINPYSKLGVNGDITLGLAPAPNGSYGKLSWRYNNSASFGASAYIDVTQVSAGNSGNMIFATNNNSPDAAEPTERLRITSTGNVGIGTTNPANKLHIFQGNLELTGGYNLSWGGDFSGGFPTIWGNGNDKTIRFAPNGQTNGLNALLGYNVSYILNGNVGIGTTNPGFKLEVNGSFAATTKSFVIPHPSKPNYQLRYACLEGPENSVYVRGRTQENVIELPDYWVDLVHEDSITVNLTPVGNKRIWIEEINNNKVYINSEDTIDCHYTVFAERKDVEKLVVEIEEN